MDGGDWKAAVHGVAEGRTRLSDFTFTFHFHARVLDRAETQQREEPHRMSKRPSGSAESRAWEGPGWAQALQKGREDSSGPQGNCPETPQGSLMETQATPPSRQGSPARSVKEVKRVC